VTPVSAEDGAAGGEPMAPPAIEPTVIETAVIVNTTPKAKARAWGGLGARREKAPVVQPLARVEEVSPSTAGSVFKPSAKALRTAAARAAAANPTEKPSRIGEVDSPHSGSGGTTGYGSSSGSFGGGATSGGGHGGDEVVAANIAATDYAKPAAQVDEAGQPALLADLATGMLARAGFPCECETIPGEYHAVKVSADEDSAGMLIGRGGSTAEAIEHLVERMASNASGDRVRMNLDINDYRVGREEQLREHTAEAVAEVRASGEPYHMESMDARERRIVHMATEDLPDITTYTVVGAGGKHVVIVKDDGTQGDDSGDGED
jgi:spoIIIJ-associated protein